MIDKILNVTDNDAIRKEEQNHDKQLKHKLLEYGIDYKIESIRPFGIRLRKIKNKKEV